MLLGGQLADFPGLKMPDFSTVSPHGQGDRGREGEGRRGKMGVWTCFTASARVSSHRGLNLIVGCGPALGPHLTLELASQTPSPNVITPVLVSA